MTLREKQSIFAKLIGYLILRTYDMGFELTLGEAWRSPEEADRLSKTGDGIKNSLHTQRLAMDLLLFKDGKFLTDTLAYQPIGKVWESFSTPDYTCCWGGRFARKDGNHFSIAHGGRK